QSADVAPWTNRFAGRLTEPHKELVQLQPVSLRDGIGQLFFRLFWRLRLHESQPVGDPVNMSVHGDGRLVEPVDEDAVRRLPSDRVEGQQALQVVGDATAELFDDLRGHPYHVPR